MDFLSFLNQDDFIVYNKKLAHKIGINPTILLMDLISKYKFFLRKGQLENGGYFYNSIENIEQDTAIKRKAQDGAIKILEEKGLIEKKNMGMPMKRYFKINIQSLKKLMGYKDIHPSMDETDTQECMPNKAQEITEGTSGHPSMDKTDIQECTEAVNSMDETDNQECTNGPRNKNILNNNNNNKKEIIEVFLSHYPRIISPLKVRKKINELIDSGDIVGSEQLLQGIEQEKKYKDHMKNVDENFKVLWKDPVNRLDGGDWLNTYDFNNKGSEDSNLISEAKELLNSNEQKELDTIIATRKTSHPHKQLTEGNLEQMLQVILEKR